MISVDQKLIDGVNKGDEQAFRSLFDSYWSYLCSVAAMYVPDSCAVEEIVGDVFMSIWNHRGIVLRFVAILSAASAMPVSAIFVPKC